MLGSYVLYQFGRAVRNPTIADAVLEERLDDHHIVGCGVGCNAPIRPEFTHVDWCPLVNHYVAFRLRISFELVEQSAVLTNCVGGGDFFFFADESAYGLVDRDSLRRRCGNG
jgi:hypothetical protein